MTPDEAQKAIVDLTDKIITAANTAVANYDFTGRDSDPDSVDEACTRVVVCATLRILAEHFDPTNNRTLRPLFAIDVADLVNYIEQGDGK